MLSVLGLLLYATAVGALVATDAAAVAEAHLPIPRWTALAVPPAAYGLLALAGIARRSLPRALAGWAALCAAHALVAAATAAAVALVAPRPDAAPMALALRGFPVLMLVQLLCVPLILPPLRRLASRPRARPPFRPITPRTAPRRAVPTTAMLTPRLAPPKAGPPATPPAVDEPAVAPADRMPAAAARAVVTERGPARPVSDSVEEVVRIPFARLADQMPAEIFRLPLDRVAANLLESEHLLIPQRLVVPQLAEGLVRIEWEVIADQFPPHLLNLDAREVGRRLPSRTLRLPLDEVIRQLPPELFLPPGPAADVRDIEDFPPPFQPYVSPPTEASAGEPEPVARAAEASLPEEEPMPMQYLAPLFGSPMGPLAMGARRGDGVSLVTLVAPPLAEPAVVATARRVLPYLDDPRLPVPASQVTLRAPGTCLVLTPFGDGGPVLVAAVPACAWLALLARLSLRAAGEARLAAVRDGAPRRTPAPAAIGAASGTGLEEVEAGPEVDALAGSLGTLGPLTPTVLQDPTGALRLFVFVGAGLEPRDIGSFAGDLTRALIEAEIGAISAIELRLGAARVVVRTLASAAARTTVLVAGPVDRPGLARLEIDRAAAALSGAR